MKFYTKDAVTVTKTTVVEIEPKKIVIELNRNEAGRLASILGKVSLAKVGTLDDVRAVCEDFVGGEKVYQKEFQNLFAGRLIWQTN